MYVVIRKYAAGGRAEEIAQRVGEGLVPILRKQSGFRAYYAFVSEDGYPIAVSICDSQHAAIQANDEVREWVAVNMKDLIPDPPEVMMGTMLVDAATFAETFDEEGEQGKKSEAWIDRGI